VVIALAVWVPGTLLAAGAAPVPTSQAVSSEKTAPALDADARVKGADEQLRAAIREGYDHSPTFRALVDHFVDHETTVHVRRAPGMAAGLQACLLHRVAVASDGARLLWVLVRHSEPSDHLVPLIAHELQHAHEALDADARTGPEMERAFQRLGERTGSSGRARNYPVYETQAALDVQDRVKREIRTRPSGRGKTR
jgi:hypothetical protein